MPIAEKNDAKRPEFKYATPSFLFAQTPYQSNLKPVNIKQTYTLAPIKKGFAKIGFGNYSNILGEVYINSGRDKELLYTAHAKYNYGKAATITKDSSAMTDVVADVMAKKILGHNTIIGGVDYNGNIFHYYGKPNEKALTGSSNYQNFSDFSIHTGLEHGLKDTGKLKVLADINYNNFQDFYHTQEHNITLNAKIIEPIKSADLIFEGVYDFIYYSYFTKRDYADVNKKKSNRGITQINARYQTQLGIVRGSIGFKTTTESDSTSSKFWFYPDLHLDVDITEKYLTAFANVTGGVQKNTFRSLAKENPFLQSNLVPKNTNAFIADVGLKGSTSSGLVYMGSLAYNMVNNMYFFANDTVESRRFVLQYYAPITTVLKVHGELGYAPKNIYSLTFGGNYYNYSFQDNTIEEPFYKPPFDVYVAGRYYLKEKLTIGSEVFAFGSRYAKTIGSSNIITLKPALDFNLWTDYNYNDRFVFFLELKNLLGTQYSLWNYYPVRGFQAVAGVKVSF
ncbi:MAG: hypothetical protein NTX03_14205 [Bacteroidetes bacterium]|nr:hypothetical protein [Bacteroidota bacterium]